MTEAMRSSLLRNRCEPEQDQVVKEALNRELRQESASHHPMEISLRELDVPHGMERHWQVVWRAGRKISERAPDESDPADEPRWRRV